MQLKFQDARKPSRYSLQQSLYKLDSRYDKDPISKQKIARSILVPSSDSISIANTFKHPQKSFYTNDQSRMMKSKISTSLGKKPSKIRNKEKEEELKYYKILFENLKQENQRLKNKNNKAKSRNVSRVRDSKVKRDKQPMDSSQIENLVHQIENIERKFKDDKSSKYERFYEKFVDQFKNVGMRKPKTTEEAWKGWLMVKKKIESMSIASL